MNYAGLSWEGAGSNYLYKNDFSMSLTPTDFSSSSGSVNILISGYGGFGNESVDSMYSLFPVINLKADTLVTNGDGSVNNPYEVR